MSTQEGRGVFAPQADPASVPALAHLEAATCAAADGRALLREVSMTLEPGTVQVVAGPSGAGKTLLVDVVRGARIPQQGHVRVHDCDTAAMSRDERAALRRRTGVVFQDLLLFDHLSAFDNIALPLRLAGLGRRDITERVGDLLAWLGLDGRGSALPAALSRKERRLVCVARAVVGRPPLILADDPARDLDHEAGGRVLYLLAELARAGAGILLTARTAPQFPGPYVLFMLASGALAAPGVGARSPRAGEG